MRALDKLNAALETQADMSKPESSRGYTPPAAGIARARIVGYFEVGAHEEDEFNQAGQKTGRKKLKHKVHIVVELSGPKHEPRELEDGTKIPQRITIKENYEPGKAPHVKSNFYDMFTKINTATGANARHMAQLLDKPFLLKIHHKESGSGENKRTYALAKGPGKEGYTIMPVSGEGPDGTPYSIQVAPAITPLKYFLFQLADKEMWDSIYIDGEVPERKDDKGNVTSPARSKNVLQNLIKSAKNFDKCPIATLVGTGKELDLGDVERPPRTEAPTPTPSEKAAPAGTELDYDDGIPF